MIPKLWDHATVTNSPLASFSSVAGFAHAQKFSSLLSAAQGETEASDKNDSVLQKSAWLILLKATGKIQIDSDIRRSLYV